MTTPDSAALATHVEMLMEGDEEIDRCVVLAIWPEAHVARWPREDDDYVCFHVDDTPKFVLPHYTSDPAAALTLVERVMPDYLWCSSDIHGPYSRVEIHKGPLPYPLGYGHGPSLPGRFARAVTAAVLRAMAERP